MALALQSIDYAYTADGILLEDCLGCYPASHAFLIYLIPSGGDGDFSPQARSLVKVILLIVQALLFLFLLLLAFFVHREFGWRTFSYVAAAQIPLNAHRAWTKSRTLLEWLLVGDAAHLLGLALIWPQIPDVLPRDLLIPFFLVLAVDGAWLGLTFLSFGSRRHFLILLKWLPTHAALGRPPESAPDEDEIFCEAVWGPAVFTLLLLLGLLLPAAAAYGASSVAMEAVAFVADGMPAFVLFSFAIVLLRLAALLSLAFVWQFRSPLHEYFTKGRRNHGDLHHLPAFVQRHVRRDVDEEALRFCCVGMKMTILKESRSAGLGSGRSRVGGARKYERFFQLSQDLSTIRWSWEDFLLIDEIIHIRYTRRRRAAHPTGTSHTTPAHLSLSHPAHPAALQVHAVEAAQLHRHLLALRVAAGRPLAHAGVQEAAAGAAVVHGSQPAAPRVRRRVGRRHLRAHAPQGGVQGGERRERQGHALARAAAGLLPVPQPLHC